MNFIFHNIRDVILPIDELHHVSRWFFDHQAVKFHHENWKLWIEHDRTINFSMKSAGKLVTLPTKPTKHGMFMGI